MIIARKKLGQRIFNASMAFCLVLSTATSSLPFLFAQSAHADSNVSTSIAPNGWGTQDGAPAYVAGPTGTDGNGSLSFTTTSATDSSNKENYFHSAGNVLLSSVNNLGYKLYNVNGVPASYQLQVNGVTRLDNASKSFTSLVWEPAYNGGSDSPTTGFVNENNLESGTWWSSHPISGADGSDYAHTYVSLKAITDANPNATVSLYGANIGSGTPSSHSYVDDISFNGTTNNFEVTPGPVKDVNTTKTYSTIQAAIDDASTQANDVITVAPGVYNENVTVDKALTIDGAQVGKDARGTRTSAETIVNGDFSLNSSNVTIDGFTVNGNPSSAAFKMLSGNSISTQIIYNTIINVGAHSAAISYNSSHDTFSHNLINMSATAYSGIQASNNPGSFTQIIGNQFAGAAPGVDADINFIGAPSYAQPATDQSGILVDSNTSDGQSGTFLAATFTSGLRVTNNIVTSDPNSVIYLSGGNNDVIVTGNNISNSARAVKVTQYVDSGHPTWPSWPTNSGVVVNNNSFSGDTDGVVVTPGAASDATVDATNNWWGSASGPTDGTSGDGSILDVNNNGTGSAAVGAVKYYAWCTLANCSTDSSVVAGMPTNLTAKFQSDSSNVANGSSLNVSAKPNGNNLELQWDAPAGWVNGYQVLVTNPDNTTSVGYGGPNTNAWLVNNGFGQHGQGKYTYTVVAANNSGVSAPSEVFTLYYDTIPPVVTVTPVAGSFLHGTEIFNIHVSENDLAPAASHVYVYLYNNAGGQKSQGANVDLSSGNGTFTVDTTKLDDGLSSLDVGRFADVAGNLTGLGDTYFYNYTVDNTTPNAPTGLYFQANNSNLTNLTINSTMSNNIVLNWTDPTNSPSGINQHITEVDGPNGYTHQFWNTYPNTWLNKNDGEFGLHGDGTYTYKVMSRNGAGTWSAWSQPLTLVYDSTNPVVTLTSPTGTTNANSVDVKGSVTDANMRYYACYITTNQPITAFGTNWSVGQEPKDNGNSLANPACVTTFTSTNAGSATGPVTLGNFDTSQLPDGTYTVHVHGQDLAGNSSEATTTFTIDRTPPAVPSDLAWTTDSNLPLALSGFTNVQKGTLSWQDSPTSDVAHYVYKFWTNIPGYFDGYSNAWTTTPADASDFTPTTTGSSIWTDFANKEGTYSFCVEAFDAAGNNSGCSDKYSVTYDATKPTAPVIDPSLNGSYFNTTPITDQWSAATDIGGSGINHYEIAYNYDNGHDFSEGTAGWTTMTNAPSDSNRTHTGTTRYISTGLNTQRNHYPSPTEQGGVTIWVRAIDNAGNVGPWSDASHYTYDSVAPTSSYVLSTNAATNLDVTATLTTSEAVNYISGWTRVSGTNNQFTKPFTDNTATGGETVNFTDLAGNPGSQVVVVSNIDRTPPLVSISAPVAGNYGHINTVNITANIDDAVSYQLYVNGTAVYSTPQSAPFVQYALPVTDGTYSIYAKATDAAGNTGTSPTTTVTINDTAPALTVVSYSGTSLTPTISGTTAHATDVVTVDGAKATVSTTANSDGTYGWTYTLPTQTVGTHTITVASTDTYGNSTSQPAEVKVLATGNTTVNTTGNSTTNAGTAGVLGTSTKNTDANSGNSGSSGNSAVLGASTKANTGWNIFGLSWYWWLLILAAIVAFLWWLIAAIRRRRQDQQGA